MGYVICMQQYGGEMAYWVVVCPEPDVGMS